jgi:tetratricopeptide (TPR) repeat protein
MRITRARVLLVLVGVLVVCVAAVVVSVRLHAGRAARKATETRRFLEAKLRYATGKERAEVHQSLLRHIISTEAPHEASMALLDMIQTYPDVAERDGFTSDRLLKEYPGTAGALLWQAESLRKARQYEPALALLAQNRVFRSVSGDARCRQLRLLNLIARQAAQQEKDPQRARDLFGKAIEASQTLALEAWAPNDIGLAHLDRAKALFERGRQFHSRADAEEARRLAAQIKDIPGLESPYLMNVGPQELIAEIDKWLVSEAK